MQIQCPHCHHLSTTRPEALMGRIYVCTHCHQILRLEHHTPNAVQWQSLTTAKAGRRRQITGSDGQNV